MPSKELVVSQTRHETKVAILEDGQLVEVYFQQENEYSLAGSIHKGRVTRVLPGMQSAFVDLGLERDTFLYVSDFFEENGEDIEKVSSGPSRGGSEERPERGGDRRRDGRRGRDDRGRDERIRDERREERRDDSREPAAFREALPSVPAVEGGEPEEGIPEALPSPAEESTIDLSSAAPQVAAEGAAATPELRDRERRGRRSRRRRNRGRGFPDSKYAPVGAGGSEPDRTDTETENEAGGETQEEERVELELLPGESLARYRNPPPVVEEPADEPEDEVEPLEPVLEVAEEDEEEAEELVLRPSAELSELEAEAVEQILERVEEQAEREALAAEPSASVVAIGEGAEVGEAGPGSEDEEGAEVEEAEAEVDVEADADGEVDAEGDVEVIPGDGVHEEIPTGELPEELAPASGDPDVEPARMPQSLTATLRAQGGRYPHRGSRRTRRRGGRDRQPVERPAGEVPPVAAPVAQEVVTQPLPERRPTAPAPSISDLLKEGQEIIVQIAKEPLGQKGARITSHIALPGRYVVYMPTVEHLGVSRKIGSDDERQRLKRILQTHRQGIVGGFIMRTAGEGKTEADIASDMLSLANLWLDIRTKAEKKRAPALLHHDVEVVERLLRDQLTDGFKAVWIDNEGLYEQVLHSIERLQPALLSRVKMYTRPEPIFDAFGITQELEKALRPKVWLKSGGYIVINQTEALVAIDVNTGKYVGRSNRLEDTIVKTNLEAVKEIVRQMRLRDLGGIIVVDFIDMEDRKNRQKVMQALEETMRVDKAPYKILQFNDFGLVAITRKRVKQSLEKALCSPCVACEGAGYLKSVQTVIGEILSQAIKYAKVVDGKECILRVHPEVAKTLKSTDNKYLEELEEVLHRPVLVVGDPLLHQEKFDLT